MRLMRRDEATVVPFGSDARNAKESGGETGRFARAQYEARDYGVEGHAVLAKKTVMPFHEPLAGLENAEALILVHSSGHDHRLIADDSIADYFGIFADRIVNQPAARKQLRGNFADVLDTDEVGEHVVGLRRLRVFPEVNGPHRDADAFGLTVEEAAGHHCLNIAACCAAFQRCAISNSRPSPFTT